MGNIQEATKNTEQARTEFDAKVANVTDPDCRDTIDSYVAAL
jgi:hypothetical protein